MTVPTLPVDGQTNWGDPLNLGILQVNTTAVGASSSAANHAANIPADPHGDRAYAQSLVNPITSGVNGPNGYVKLNSSGQLLSSLYTGTNGAFTNVYDVVTQYSAVPNTGSNQSVHIQNALNAAASAGGGIVWIPNGVYSLNNYLVIGSNTAIVMSRGAVLSRISGSPTPPYIISNVQFGTSNTPATNVAIVGGKLDAVGAGSLAAACTPIFLIQADNAFIQDVNINTVFNSPAIELNGCTNSSINDVKLDGTNKASGSAATVPAIRLNLSSASTTPSGLAGGIYNSATCNNIKITQCFVRGKNNTFGPFGSFVGSDLSVAANFHQFISIVGGGTHYNDSTNFATPSIFSNAVWKFTNVTGVSVPENSQSIKDGWITLSLQHGWSNSGNGPNLQYRILSWNGGGASTAQSASGNVLEIIGDLNSGTQADDTVLFTLPSWISVSTDQLIPILAPGTNSASNMRLLFLSASNNVTCRGISGLGAGGRVTFHTFVSLTA